MEEVKKKICGSLLAGAIGDALGYQIEFKRNIKEKEITKFNGHGIISDDTQMTLFTANALIWNATRASMRGISMLPEDAVYLGYLDWLDTQYHRKGERSISWIKDIPELNVPRAPGNTCMMALASGKKGTIEEPINNSKGCGGVMRVAPVGLYHRNSRSAGIIAARVSAITHGHPLGIIPAYILSSMISLIVYKNMSIESALDKAIEELEEDNIFDQENINIMLDLIKKAKELSKENILDTLAIKKIGEGWVAEEALAIALYSALKYSNSIEEPLICAVNHDGDSDSTGAIAGNIIGASLGVDNISKYYLDDLELKDVIIEIANDLGTKIPISEYSKDADENWEKKYIYCKRL